MYESLAVRAERGAKLLDEQRPDWWRRDFDDLDMGSCTECILGTLGGNYLIERERLFAFGDLGDEWYEAARHGFSLYIGEPNHSDSSLWRDLGECWKAEIAKRRNAN